MEFPAFAYYKSMQLLLAFTTCCIEFVLMFMIAGTILTLFKVNASNKQKTLFAFLSGTVLQAGWSYSFYFLNGLVSFTPMQYLFITTPNPIAAVLYCWLAIKIFKLSPIRSVKMMSYVYIFWCLIKSFGQILGSFLFLQEYQHWNYLMDIIKQCAACVLYLGVFFIVKFILRHNKITIASTNNRFFEPKKEMAIYFLKALFIYSISLFFPVVMNNAKLSTILGFVVNLIFFACVIGFEIKRYYNQIIENNNAHISTLLNGAEAFRGIKHDFYNILQTYSGYLEIGEVELLKKYHSSLVGATMYAGTSMELSWRIQENPAFVSLLISKLEYAERVNVTMHHSLQCDFSDFYIDTMEMCRMLGCLLDAAIERAAASTEKKICFSLENKNSGSKLIIITSSTDLPVDVEEGIYRRGSGDDEDDVRLATVRGIIDKYGNCSSQVKYFNFELSVYIEVQKI